jgi:diguanylate cyclase (GGDEF)-like protein/PAS domain S-box-containing protein
MAKGPPQGATRAGGAARRGAAASPAPAAGKRPLRYASLRDPTTLLRFVHQLREGIYITDPDGRILDANPALLEMFGFTGVEAMRRSAATELYVDLARRAEELALLEAHGEVREFEFEVRRPDGEVRTVLDTCYRVRDGASGTTYYHGILVDITPRKRLEAQLRDASLRDELTGCLNRRFLADLAARFDPTGFAWGVIVVDIDHFKRFNDCFGHEVGDAVLQEVAGHLRERLRDEDHVVRTGGDEFLALLAGADEARTREIAERLRGGASLRATLSLGWAVRQVGEPLERTIARADRQLFARREAERGVRYR